MAESPDLTTRDVFAQVDRRLARLEDDFREFRRYVEERFAAMERKFEGRFAALERKVDERFEAMERKFEGRFAALERKGDERFEAMERRFDGLRTDFRWILGIMLASWLSVMGTLLLK